MLPYDAPVDSSFISAGAGLLGALIGGGTTLLGGQIQHRWQVRSEVQKLLAANADQAARRADQFLVDIQRCNERRWQLPTEPGSERWDVERELDQAIREVSVQVQYLRPDFRNRLALLMEMLEIADWIAFEGQLGGTHYHRESSVVHNVAAHGRFVLAAHFRGESVPDESPLIREYVRALGKAKVNRDEMYSIEDEQDRGFTAARETFYQENPDLQRKPKG